MRSRREGSHASVQVRTCVNVVMCRRVSVNTTNMMCVHARACMHSHTHWPAECVPVKVKEQKKDNRERAWAQVQVCVSVRACVNTHTLNARVITCA